MKLVLCALAAAMVAATPALADGARVEVQSGIDWAGGAPVKGLIGAAGGYDWSLPGGVFVGAEESVDKTLAEGYHVRWGTSGRIGAHIDPKDKLYLTAGYNYGVGPHASDVGAGLEHSFAGPMYAKVEYKHYFTEEGLPNSNGALVGVGLHF
jgi:hypothetical protein